MVKVVLISHTPEPEKVVAAAAKMCYSKSGPEDIMSNLTPENTEDSAVLFCFRPPHFSVARVSIRALYRWEIAVPLPPVR